MTAEILERKTNEEAATVMRLKKQQQKHVYVCQPHCRIEQSPVVFRLTQER